MGTKVPLYRYAFVPCEEKGVGPTMHSANDQIRLLCHSLCLCALPPEKPARCGHVVELRVKNDRH